MFTIFIVLINLVVTGLGIYIFDYKIDGVINNPLVIVLSIVVGVLALLLTVVIYIQVFYFIVGKRLPQDNMFKHFIAKQMMAIPLYGLNMRTKIIGLENLPKDPGFTIYANHTSMMDIPLIMCKLKKYPVGFLAKKVVVELPLIGKWTPVIGCVSLDRENTRKGAEAIIQVIKNVKKGSTMVIFPEGTRTKNIGQMIEFKPGSFKVALKSKKPLVPMTIVKPKNFNSIKWPFTKKVTLVIHKPIEFEDLKKQTTQELSDNVKSIIQTALDDVSY